MMKKRAYRVIGDNSRAVWVVVGDDGSLESVASDVEGELVLRYRGEDGVAHYEAAGNGGQIDAAVSRALAGGVEIVDVVNQVVFAALARGGIRQEWL